MSDVIDERDLDVALRNFTTKLRELRDVDRDRLALFAQILENFNVLIARLKLHVQVTDGKLTCYVLPGGRLFDTMALYMRVFLYVTGHDGMSVWKLYNQDPSHPNDV